ncbi:tetratricopeptide repeat protein [Flavobacterium ardleyense]|uniref:Tetratricopeptide repeat protein n=1 Tax=Flavobacterium ardleyense TaxID=2038737 RepID=A0ABW5Z8H1_9FLAO
MRKISLISFFIFFITFSFGTNSFAQENPEDLALVDNKIEDDFYTALEQRGIENYDKAIIAIQKCIEKEPKNPAFYYELGKNQLDLKNYIGAETAFKKAVEFDSKQRWYWNGLYDVYYQTRDFEKSIPIVEKLIEFDPNMREDLVSLYMNTNQKEKALNLLKEMQATSHLSSTMVFYKLKIEESNEFAKPKKETLEEGIKKNPKYEQNYIDLIVLYTSFNQEDKAFEVAKRLEKEIPNSDWAHVTLVKFYLDKNEGANASKSMFKVLGNDKIDLKIKHRVFNEFLIFAIKNPEFFKDVDEAIPYFNSDNQLNVSKEVAKFFWTKKDLEKAIYYFDKALKSNSQDVETMDYYLSVLIQKEDYKALIPKAEAFLELYPTQPSFYYYAGFASNKINQFKKAKDFLENGLDFVVDDKAIERDFYTQLIISCENLGDVAKKQSYSNKLKQVK